MSKIIYKRSNYNHIINDCIEDDDDEIIYYKYEPIIKINKWKKILLFLISIICGKYYTTKYKNY